MKTDISKVFISYGVYLFNQGPNDNIFLCEPVTGNQIGKLVMYKKLGEDVYQKTATSYFLNSYCEGSLKELFLNRKNYDMIGTINKNYCLSADEKYIVKGELDNGHK